ncbi:MAG: peptidoglycan editing factor PgeF [Luteitalea sp.]
MPMPPVPAPPFHWVDAPWGPVLVCAALSPFADHLFSARGLDVPDAQGGAGWGAVGTYLGVADTAVWRLRQVHGVAAHTEGVAPCDGAWPDGDLLATTRDDVALAIRTADCLPILLVDQATGAVAAVHAGWRGTAQGAVMQMVRVLEARFGSRPADLLAAIGPSVGPDAYEVGQDVIDAFTTAFPEHARSGRWWTARADRPGKYLIDLWTATRDQLVLAGVDDTQVHLAGLCTATCAGMFHSYRTHGAASGRMVAAIRRVSAPR